MNSTYFERRAHPRCTLPCQIIVLENGTYWSGGAIDLSLGGIALESKTHSPEASVARLVLGFAHAKPIVVSAEISSLRAGVDGGFLVSYAFVGLDAKTSETIEDAFTKESSWVIRIRRSAAVVVDRSASIRQQICDTISGLGGRALGVATVLDVLNRIHTPQPKINTVFVGEPSSANSGRELAEFLASEYGDLRVVALPDDFDAVVNGTPPAGNVRCCDTLRKPWSTSRLGAMMVPCDGSSSP